MTSPVTVQEFQTYLRDSSTDPALLAYYQELLDRTTDYIVGYIEKDYTANAVKTDVFWGDDTDGHRLTHPAGVITQWKHYGHDGSETTEALGSLALREHGSFVVAYGKTFASGREHRLTYQLPNSLEWPIALKQVITELTAMLFEASKQGQGTLFIEPIPERHRQILDQYRTIPV